VVTVAIAIAAATVAAAITITVANTMVPVDNTSGSSSQEVKGLEAFFRAGVVMVAEGGGTRCFCFCICTRT